MNINIIKSICTQNNDKDVLEFLKASIPRSLQVFAWYRCDSSKYERIKIDYYIEGLEAMLKLIIILINTVAFLQWTFSIMENIDKIMYYTEQSKNCL